MKKFKNTTGWVTNVSNRILIANLEVDLDISDYIILINRNNPEMKYRAFLIENNVRRWLYKVEENIENIEIFP